MKLHLTRPLVVFDLETTGVQITRDRIVEISILKVHPDGLQETRTRRINPGMPIPPESTAVHGIRCRRLPALRSGRQESLCLDRGL